MSFAHDQIGEVIELGRFAIDDHESRAVPFSHQRETRRRPHDQRGTNCQKKVAASGQFLGSLHRVRWHRLPERNSRGFDVAAAGAVGRHVRRRFKFFPDPGQFVAPGAVEADGIGRIAMELDHIGGCNS